MPFVKNAKSKKPMHIKLRYILCDLKYKKTILLISNYFQEEIELKTDDFVPPEESKLFFFFILKHIKIH